MKRCGSEIQKGNMFKGNELRENVETILTEGAVSNNTFDGNTIENNQFGIALIDARELKFINNIMKNNNAATQEDSRAALYMQQVYDSEIAGNVIEGQYEAMRVRDSEGNMFKGNELRENVETILTEGAVSNNTFDGNTIENNQFGIALIDARELKFINNIMKNNNASTQEEARAGLILYQVYDSEIAGNVIEGQYEAMRVRDSEGNMFKGNELRENVETILTEGAVSNNTFDGNTIENNQFGIALIDARELKFINNIMKNNNAATQEDSRAALYMQQVYDSEIAGNVIESQYEAMRVRDSEGNMFKGNELRENVETILTEGAVSNNTFDGNTIENNQFGVALIDARELKFINNIMKNNNAATQEDSRAALYMQQVYDSEIAYNTFVDNYVCMELVNSEVNSIHDNIGCDVGEEVTPPPEPEDPRISSEEMEFSWTSLYGAKKYRVFVGTKKGKRNIMKEVVPNTQTSLLIQNIPLNGNPFYVRLMAKVGKNWVTIEDYEYETVDLSKPAEITNFVDGSAFAFDENGNVTFEFDEGKYVNKYKLIIGPKKGSWTYYKEKTVKTNDPIVVSTIPQDAQSIYVRLKSKIGDKWFNRDYTFVAP